MPRPLMPTAEAISMLRHVRYEIEKMLPAFDDWRRAADLRASGQAVDVSRPLELFLMHARVLCGFFEMGPRRKGDVSCRDFGYTAPSEVIDTNEFSRINKRLAHLTYDRDSLEERWTPETFCKLFDTCAAFARCVEVSTSSVSEVERASWFHEGRPLSARIDLSWSASKASRAHDPGGKTGMAG